MGIPRRTAHACAGWSDAIGRRAILEFIGSASRYLGGGHTAVMSRTGFDGGIDFPRSRMLSGCGDVVVGLELNGRSEADLAVQGGGG